MVYLISIGRCIKTRDMKYYYSFVIILLTLLNSCADNVNIFNKHTLYLTDDNMPSLQQLNLEKINLLEEERIALSIKVYNDSVLIINKSYSSDSFLLSLVNLKNHSLIGEYYKRGNGPNELLRIAAINYQNRLTVYDITKNQISFFYLDSALSNRQFYRPNIQSMEGRDFGKFDLLTDTTLIFYNPWHLKNCGNVANEYAPELLISGLDGDFKYIPPENAAFVANEAQAYIVSNIDKNRVFIAYNSIPQFTFLNTNLDTIKVIHGPDIIKRKNYKYKNINGEIYNSIKNSYSSSIYTDDNNIFVSNKRISGLIMKDFVEFTKTLNNNRPELFRFDWEGNLIARYQLPSRFSSISFSETTNTLYITVRDENDELCLYKAQL